MECKNCQATLKETAKFCDECGGKIIQHRLNFKTVTEEFFATFISWDNTFLKTIFHLFTKPEVVVNGYLNGTRKRYMKPFSYMIMILSLYGIYMFFAKEQMIAFTKEMSSGMFQSDNMEKNATMLKNFEKWMGFATKYFNVFTILMIPLLAFINKIIFKKINFIEHNVALFYAYATYLIAVVVIGISSLLLNIPFSTIYTLIMLIMVGYHIYFYKKLFNLNVGETVLKTLYFWLLLGALYIVTIIIGSILVFILLKLNLIQP